MTDDLQQARISAEVLNEYRKIAAWLEAQAATRGPVGDTMHGLAAEALTNLIEHEYSRHTIPLYGMLDLWMALYGTSHPQFDEFYEKHGYAETWARLLAEVRSRAAAPAERDAALAAIERVRAIHFEDIAYADDSYGPEPRPDNYERHYCSEDGEDWPCPTIQALDGAPEPEVKP